MKKKIKWSLLVTREACLLERYLRVLGYRKKLLPVTEVGVENLLGLGINSLVKIYYDPEDREKRLRIIRQEFSYPGMKKRRDKYFWEVIKNIRKTQKELNVKKNLKALKEFIKYYTYCRAIVWYALEIGQAVNDQGLIIWAGKWHQRAEEESCWAWDRLNPYFKDLSRKTGVPINDIFFYTAPEFFNLVKKIKKIKKQIIEQRKKKYVLLCLDSKIKVLIGKKCDQYIKNNLPQRKIPKINILKGKCGNKGQVKGRVCRVVKVEDMKKMKQGDILVTIMTSPRLAGVFSKAKAFITDEGGITSHAAIVSREMNIPCVIGTKIATKVLKDGDKVLVDADKGIIKKLS
ncbi:MAG: PEP-utilizing enzyme [Patescibacteria group bacterium]|nr:PEP-utilizing enzyme [Patescibacteria group bacterium]